MFVLHINSRRLIDDLLSTHVSSHVDIDILQDHVIIGHGSSDLVAHLVLLAVDHDFVVIDRLLNRDSNLRIGLVM